jgi:hypothetical protein
MVASTFHDVFVSIAVCLPPICCHPKELVHGEKNILTIHALGNHELLRYPLESILGLHGILSLGERGGASS